MSNREFRAHDETAHKRWEVDWEEWLVARGFEADGSDISSTSFTLTTTGTATITFQDRLQAVARVWINNVTFGEKVTVNALIQMPSPGGGAPVVVDTFRFEIRGTRE